jgi:peptidoglycan/LPS O-acetylase OafA/YrhL
VEYNVTIGRMRGLCILAVVILHYGLFFPSIFTFMSTGERNGYYGVTAFFAISGFLITSHLILRRRATGSIDFTDFYARRAARILPMLFLTIAILSLFALLELPNFTIADWQTYAMIMLTVLTFQYNHYLSWPFPWTVLWSLSIEEMFYLGYPIVLWALPSLRLVVGFLIAVVILGPISRAQGPGWYEVLFTNSACNEAIALGALAALAAGRYEGLIGSKRSIAILLAGSATVAVAYFTLNGIVHYVVGPSTIAIGTALILFVSRSVSRVGAAAPVFDPLAFLGRYSYEMYLLHMIVIGLLRPIVPQTLNPFLLFALFMFVTVGLSVLAGRYFSEPLNRAIRARFTRPPAPKIRSVATLGS